MKKRLTAVVLSMTLIVANLVGCSDRNDSESSESKVTETTTTVTTETKKDTSSEVTTTETSKGDESTTTTSSTETTTQSSSEPKNSNRVILGVKNIQQKPELPKGSEITCATMVLNYYGFNVSKMDMLKYLPISEAPDANGVWVSADEAYVGNPKLETGYGCKLNVLETAINNYWQAKKITGYKVSYSFDLSISFSASLSNFDNFYKEIDTGNPIIILATTNMMDVKFPSKGWQTKDDLNYIWPTNSHCFVLIGYDKDKNTLIFNDPLNPSDTAEYPRETVEKIYKKRGLQALAIRKG